MLAVSLPARVTSRTPHIPTASHVHMSWMGQANTFVIYKQFKNFLLTLGREHVLHKMPSARLCAAQTSILRWTYRPALVDRLLLFLLPIMTNEAHVGMTH